MLLIKFLLKSKAVGLIEASPKVVTLAMIALNKVDLYCNWMSTLKKIKPANVALICIF